MNRFDQAKMLMRVKKIQKELQKQDKGLFIMISLPLARGMGFSSWMKYNPRGKKT